MSPSDNARLWVEFFLQHERGLTAYALRLTQQMSDAQDLIQEAIVRMVREERPVVEAKMYVYRCLRNLACDHHRAQRRLAGAIRGAADRQRRQETQAGPEPVDGAWLEVEAALDALDAPSREVIVLRVFAEMTFREIAQMVEKPAGTVASLYARGLAELRSRLSFEVRHA